MCSGATHVIGEEGHLGQQGIVHTGHLADAAGGSESAQDRARGRGHVRYGVTEAEGGRYLGTGVECARHR